ncbi:MAG: TraR/DksA C4-type zinc finger protein [Chloroflexi bacterium]|nr:TraR/DksA C4-type zinc finger protein [Chloroflexota bacterium]
MHYNPLGIAKAYLPHHTVLRMIFELYCGASARIHNRARQSVQSLAPDRNHRWEKYLLGYQRIPDEELSVIQDVLLSIPIEKLINRAGAKARCEQCGEEIFNEREVVLEKRVFCRPCKSAAISVAKVFAMLGKRCARVSSVSRKREMDGFIGSALIFWMNSFYLGKFISLTLNSNLLIKSDKCTLASEG